MPYFISFMLILLLLISNFTSSVPLMNSIMRLRLASCPMENVNRLFLNEWFS